MCGVGVGSARTRAVKSGSMSAMKSGSGGAASGEIRGCVKVNSARVSWKRCVVRAVWAVMRLNESQRFGPVLSAKGSTYRVAPFSTPAWEPKSLRESATRCTIPSASLPFASVPLRTRLSTVARRASREGDKTSRSLSSP